MKALTGRMTARVKGILKNLLVVVKLYLQLSSFSYVEINKTNLHLVSYPDGQICTQSPQTPTFWEFCNVHPGVTVRNNHKHIITLFKQVFFSLHRQISIVDVLYSGEYDIMMLL